MTGSAPLFSTESLTVNMYLSSTEMTRLNFSPAPLSQVSVTGLSALSFVASASTRVVAVRRLHARRAGDEAGFGPIGRGRAGRREQRDVRALGIDGLAIGLQDDVVDQAARQVDRAAEARRVDGDARARGERLGARLRPRPRRRAAPARRAGAGGGAARRRAAAGVCACVAPGCAARSFCSCGAAKKYFQPISTSTDRTIARMRLRVVLGVHDRLSLSVAGRARRRAPRGRLGERSLDVGDQRGEGTRQRLAARHQHVIMIRRAAQPLAARLSASLQAAADAIALHGVADFLGDGEADARRPARRAGVGARLGLQRERSRRGARRPRATRWNSARRLSRPAGRRRSGRSPCVVAKASGSVIAGLLARDAVASRGGSSRKALAAARAARVRAPCGRRPSPCARESRGGACARACSVDRSASRHSLQNGEIAGESAIGFPNKPTPDLAAPPPSGEPSHEPGKCRGGVPSRGAYRCAPRAASQSRAGSRARRRFSGGRRLISASCPAMPPREDHATRSTFDGPPFGLGWSARTDALRPSALAR